MKKISKNTRDILFLFIIVVLAIGMGLVIYGKGTELHEPFIPAINSVYRPFVRKVHKYTSEKFNNMTNKVHRFLRQYKIT